MEWPLIEQHFRPDGSLRDIYIESTTEVDWVAIWRLLDAWMPKPVFRVDGDIRPRPSSVSVAWAVARDHHVTVLFKLVAIEVVLHFFTIDEIELDIDPAQICSPETAQLLETLMAKLGVVTGKAVLLTQETSKADWIARFEPSSEALTWNERRRGGLSLCGQKQTESPLGRNMSEGLTGSKGRWSVAVLLLIQFVAFALSDRFLWSIFCTGSSSSNLGTLFGLLHLLFTALLILGTTSFFAPRARLAYITLLLLALPLLPVQAWLVQQGHFKCDVP